MTIGQAASSLNSARTRTLAPPALGIIILMLGCGNEPEATLPPATVDTLASGRVVVTNAAEGRSPAVIPAGSAATPVEAEVA